MTASEYLQTGDTLVTVLDERGSFKGRLWTYLDPLGQQVITTRRAPTNARTRGVPGELSRYLAHSKTMRREPGRPAQVAAWRRAALLANQWTALQRFVEDGRLVIDNNRAENELRVIAVGRNCAECRIMQSCQA